MTSRLSKLALDPLSFPTVFWESTSPCPAYLHPNDNNAAEGSALMQVSS